MSTKCIYCGTEQTEEPKGQLMRCCECQKVFEVDLASLPPRKRAAAKNQQVSTTNKRLKLPPVDSDDMSYQSSPRHPPVNLDVTEYARGLEVATISVFIGYFLLAIGILIIIFSYFTKHVMLGILTGAAIFVSSIFIIICGFSAKAIMKSADYLRIIAERMD